MSLQIEALSPIMWTIIIAVALVLIAAVVFTWKSSAMSTRKMVTIAMLTAVYVVLNFAGTVRLGWINISVASLPVIVGAMLYGPVGGLLVGLLGAFMGQLLTYGVTATTILWILPQAARGLLVGVYAKHCGYKFSSGQLTLALIGTALEQGANFFDHADIYGGGRSEEIFARAVHMNDDVRERLILQSKCGIREGMFDFSKEHILTAAEGILRRLKTDYLDVLLLHRPDALVEPEEVAEAFDRLRESGKVRYFGVRRG